MLFLILMRYIVRKKQHRRSCANQEFLIESLELSSQKKILMMLSHVIYLLELWRNQKFTPLSLV